MVPSRLLDYYSSVILFNKSDSFQHQIKKSSGRFKQGLTFKKNSTGTILGIKFDTSIFRLLLNIRLQHSQKLHYRHFEDFEKRIPRAEVEQIQVFGVNAQYIVYSTIKRQFPVEV